MELAPALRPFVRELALYEALLRKWQKSINLVAPGTLPTLWTRHFADSAQVLERFPNVEKWADLGAGAGFPGMVLAICLRERPGAKVHLIESDQRKASFLRAVSRETGAPAEIHLGRIETELPKLEGSVDAVTARALAPLSQLVEWSRELLLKSTVGVFLKGEDWAIELTDSKVADNFQVRTFASRTHSSGRIIAIARDFGV
nr:16S rRNA (guanine(527)-N(7))-methyltransferase RsmG [Methylosinus sp. Sm6]